MTYPQTPGQPDYGQPGYGQPGYGQPAVPQQPTGFLHPESYVANVEPYQPPQNEPVPAQSPAAPPFFYNYGPAMMPPPAIRTNGLAIASMVVSIVSIFTVCLFGLGAVVGITGAILGHVALSQIGRTGENGRSQAMAGVIIGWLTSAGTIGFFLLAFISNANGG